jgi:hypothetical protein
MDVAVRKDVGPGHSHEHRLAVARRLAARVLDRHGEAVVAIALVGSAATGADGPYSDLDVTVMTREDVGDQSKCYPLEGLQINLDYQTVEESFAEAREPHGGGCWLACVPLYDPAGLTRELASAHRAVGPEACREAFLRLVRDDLSTLVGKARNAALAGDRASFLAALCAFGRAACRALCVLNGNRSATGEAGLIALAKSLAILPPRFGELIDVISGAVPSCDQAMYDSLEEAWAGIRTIVEGLGLRWQESDLLV